MKARSTIPSAPLRLKHGIGLVSFEVRPSYPDERIFGAHGTNDRWRKCPVCQGRIDREQEEATTEDAINDSLQDTPPSGFALVSE